MMWSRFWRLRGTFSMVPGLKKIWVSFAWTALWPVFFSPVALQSPIEYQRKESTSHSLGRNIKSSSAATSVLWPRSSSSMDHRQQPSLLSYNSPLASWHPQQHSLASKAVSGRHLHSVLHRNVSLFVNFSNNSLPPQVSNPCVPQSTHPPVYCHQQLSLSMDGRHRTSNNPCPNSEPGIQVGFCHHSLKCDRCDMEDF